MKKAEAIKYLCQCADRNGKHWWQGITFPADECPTCDGTNEAGHLRAFSKYGRTTADCAPVAWRLAYVISSCNGEEITLDTLDHAMSLVVNEHDDVASIIRAHGNYKYR